jgi:farnesyl-diphosphate farnesyltransferase
LTPAGLKPQDLLDSANASRFTPLYKQYLARAQDHLTAGWKYTNQLPRRQVRVRLACAWPILIGDQTLRKLSGANVLDGTQRVKITRSEIRHILFRSLYLYPFQNAWRRQYKE